MGNQPKNYSIRSNSMNQSELRTLLLSKYDKMLLNKKETANEMNVSEATIDRLRKHGAIKSKKVGGQIFFTISEIADYLAA